MLVKDGFPGQRLRVLAPPTVSAALRSPLTGRLLVTDVGYFPHAAAHGRVRPHGARETIVIVCVAGSGRVKLDKTLYYVGPGEAVVISPEVPHIYMADEADPWSIWWMHVTGSDVPEITQLIQREGAGPVVWLRDPRRTTACIEKVIDALGVDDIQATLYEASGAAWQMLAYIAADVQRGKKTLVTDSIRLVQDYLRANLSSTLGVPELARMANLSTSHFSALFRAATGMTVTEYLKRLRSARARELLITTSATIAEVAERVGYSDAFYFSKQFRAINGVCPRDFRRRHHDSLQPSEFVS